MTAALTRRASGDGWFVFYGDVQVGHIGRRSGIPPGAPEWAWHCGFHPGCDLKQNSNGTADTFEQARAEFSAAWERLLPQLTEAHFEVWRHNRDYHAWLRTMRERGLELPTQRPTGVATCFCGAEISTSAVPVHIQRAHRGLGA